MTLLVSTTRARMQTTLAGLSDDALEALIAAVSNVIIARYDIPGATFPDDTPPEVQEAVVQYMTVLQRDASVTTERLGDWSATSSTGASQIPAFIATFLRRYIKKVRGPQVVKVDL